MNNVIKMCYDALLLCIVTFLYASVYVIAKIIKKNVILYCNTTLLHKIHNDNIINDLFLVRYYYKFRMFFYCILGLYFII